MKLFILLIIFSIPIFSLAQDSDTTKESKKDLPYYIEICKDLMTDKAYAFGSKGLICSQDGIKGFAISISWNYKNDKVTYSGLNVTSAGVGDCMEKDQLLFLFEDESKFDLTSWNDFNCKGKSYFDILHKAFDNLYEKKVVAIRLTNGRTFDSFTYKVPPKEQSFFIEAKNALDKKAFVPTKCDE